MISGARLTNEELFLLKNLAQVAGTANLDHSGGECYQGLTEGLAAHSASPPPRGPSRRSRSATPSSPSVPTSMRPTRSSHGGQQAVKRNQAQLWLVADKLGKFAKLPGAKNLLHRPGMELDVLNGLACVLLDEGLAHTDGVEGLAELQKALAGFDADAVAARTGVDADALRIAARQLAAAKKSAILLAYGLPYTAYSRELGIAAANLAILAGIPGRAGSGLYVCGEKANSQGAIDLGIVPQAGGLGAQAMLDAAAGGKLGALYVVGEDLLTSYPDRNKVERALDKVPFLWCRTFSFRPRRPRPMWFCRPLPSPRRTAPSLTPSGAFSGCAGDSSAWAGPYRRDDFRRLIEKLGGKLAFTGPAAIFAEIARNVPAYSGINFNGIGAQGVVWVARCWCHPRRRLQPVGGATPVEGAFQLLTGSALYHSGTVSTAPRGLRLWSPQATSSSAARMPRPCSSRMATWLRWPATVSNCNSRPRLAIACPRGCCSRPTISPPPGSTGSIRARPPSP